MFTVGSHFILWILTILEERYGSGNRILQNEKHSYTHFVQIPNENRQEIEESVWSVNIYWKFWYWNDFGYFGNRTAPHCTDCDQCMKVCRKHNAISIGVTFFCTWNMQVALHCNSLFKNRGVKQTSDKKNEQTLDHFCVEYFFFSIKDNNFSSHNLYLSYAMIYLDLRRECVGFFIHVLKCFQFGIDWSKRVENSNQPFRIGDSISKLVTETNVVI